MEIDMEFNRLVLHHCPATRSVRVRWMLHETVGENFEVRRVDLYEGAQLSAEYLALNPHHNVPMLEIHWQDGSIQPMLESAAIVEWLAEQFPEKALTPPIGASRERTEYLQYLHYGATWMDMMLWQIRAHKHILPAEDADQKTIARYEKKFRDECEPHLARRLEQGDFVLGNAFSSCDVILGYNVFWARGYGLCEGEIFGRYLERLMARPGFQRALDDLGDFSIEPASESPIRRKFTG